MEKISVNKGHIYKLCERITFIYKESVVYLYVQVTETRKGLKSAHLWKADEDYVIIYYIEANELSAL